MDLSSVKKVLTAEQVGHFLAGFNGLILGEQAASDFRTACLLLAERLNALVRQGSGSCQELLALLR